MKDFLDLYPSTGPDAGTGPRSREVCVCSHHMWTHHQLGACMVLDGRGGYCGCLDYKEAA